MTDASLYDELRACLAEVRRRWTTIVALRRVARGTAAAAVILVLATVTDRAFHPDGLLLVWLWGTAAVSAALTLANTARRMPRPPSDRQVARFVEERSGATDEAVWDESLISAVDAAERPSSSQPAFLPFIFNQAIGRVRALDASRLIEPTEIRRRGLSAAAGSAALLLVIVASLPSFQRAIDTARLKLFPGSVHVQVEPGDV